MATINYVELDSSDTAISSISTFVQIICAFVLLMFATNNEDRWISSSSFDHVVAGIATLSLLIALVQRHRRKKRNVNCLKRVVTPIDLSSVNSAVNVVSSENDRSGNGVILQLVSNKILNSRTMDPDINSLHNHVDECALSHNISGSKVLLIAFGQRGEHWIADCLISISVVIIWAGKVKLNFLQEAEKPHEHFHEIWLEDIEMTETARDRIRFGFARVFDAFGIVLDHGCLSTPCTLLKKVFHI